MLSAINSKDKNYPSSDYTSVYERIMQFDKNKSAFIHQWYPFVEGYSKEFINSVLDELDYTPILALDPFAGSGTTPLELQSHDIKCVSFEVSPFMHLLATVKMESTYTEDGLINVLITVGSFLNGIALPIRDYIDIPVAKTFTQNEKLSKWIFDTEVMDGILDIKHAIKLIDNEVYSNLLKIALAAILLDVSNVYRDGKSVKYKSNWKLKNLNRRDIHKKFLDILDHRILPDIKKLENFEINVNNKTRCYNDNVLNGLQELKDDSIDLVITSPPYLNSRDYTDIYIVELWMLDLIENYDQLKQLRKRTLRSHVQVKHGLVEVINSDELRLVITKLESCIKDHWNKELVQMIKGYFKDMEILFKLLKAKMRPNKRVYFNVANSAYYGVEIQVDIIIADIAEQAGFNILEIRKARDLKPSSQQKDVIKSLRETVIVMNS